MAMTATTLAALHAYLHEQLELLGRLAALPLPERRQHRAIERHIAACWTILGETTPSERKERMT